MFIYHFTTKLLKRMLKQREEKQLTIQCLFILTKVYVIHVSQRGYLFFLYSLALSLYLFIFVCLSIALSNNLPKYLSISLSMFIYSQFSYPFIHVCSNRYTVHSKPNIYKQTQKQTLDEMKDTFLQHNRKRYETLLILEQKIQLQNIFLLTLNFL